MADSQGRFTPGESRGTGLYAPDAKNRPLIFLGSALAIILIPCTIIALVLLLTAIGLTALLASAIAAPLVLAVTGVIVRLRQRARNEI